MDFLPQSFPLCLILSIGLIEGEMQKTVELSEMLAQNFNHKYQNTFYDLLVHYKHTSLINSTTVLCTLTRLEDKYLHL